MGWLSLVSTLLSGLIRLWEQFGSDTAILNRLKVKQASIQGRQAAEAARLKDAYRRFELAPDLKGQALVDKLTELSKRSKLE